MTRSRCRMLVFVLALVVIAAPSLAAESARIGSKSNGNKRHAADNKLIRKSYAVAEPINAMNDTNADKLVQAIVRAVKPKSWKGKGGSATIEYLAEKKILIVEQTPEAQRRIGSVLAVLTTLCHKAHASSSAGAHTEHPYFLLLDHSTTKSIPSGQPKQYGHVVLDDVRVNAMGVHCAVKRIRLLYKGDGLDTGLVKTALAKSESEQQESSDPIVGLLKKELDTAAVKAPEPEGKEPAELKRLAGEDGKKEVKVVLWTYMNSDPREEFIQADRQLADMLAEEIRKLSEANNEKITIVKPSLVEQYKNRHDNWKAMQLEKVGHDFDADYVINLDIDKLSLYAPNSLQQLYRGQTEILVCVMDMKHPDDPLHKEFKDRYPGAGHGAMDTFEMSPTAFREKFLRHAAQRLAFYFVDHPKRTRKVTMDD